MRFGFLIIISSSDGMFENILRLVKNQTRHKNSSVDNGNVQERIGECFL